MAQQLQISQGTLHHHRQRDRVEGGKTQQSCLATSDTPSGVRRELIGVDGPPICPQGSECSLSQGRKARRLLSRILNRERIEGTVVENIESRTGAKAELKKQISDGGSNERERERGREAIFISRRPPSSGSQNIAQTFIPRHLTTSSPVTLSPVSLQSLCAMTLFRLRKDRACHGRGACPRHLLPCAPGSFRDNCITARASPRGKPGFGWRVGDRVQTLIWYSEGALDFREA